MLASISIALMLMAVVGTLTETSNRFNSTGFVLCRML